MLSNTVAKYDSNLRLHESLISQYTAHVYTVQNQMNVSIRFARSLWIFHGRPVDYVRLVSSFFVRIVISKGFTSLVNALLGTQGSSWIRNADILSPDIPSVESRFSFSLLFSFLSFFFVSFLPSRDKRFSRRRERWLVSLSTRTGCRIIFRRRE